MNTVVREQRLPFPRSGCELRYRGKVKKARRVNGAVTHGRVEQLPSGLHDRMDNLVGDIVGGPARTRRRLWLQSGHKDVALIVVEGDQMVQVDDGKRPRGTIEIVDSRS